MGIIGANDSVRFAYRFLPGGYLAPTHDSRGGIEKESIVPGSGFGPDAGEEFRGTTSNHRTILKVSVRDNRSRENIQARVEREMRVQVERHAGADAELRRVAAGELKASSRAHVDRLSAEFELPNVSPFRLWWDKPDMVLPEEKRCKGVYGEESE